MIPQEIIRLKRNGDTLSAADIDGFIGALARGELAESQIGAFAMAVWFRGMTRDELREIGVIVGSGGGYGGIYCFAIKP